MKVLDLAILWCWVNIAISDYFKTVTTYLFILALSEKRVRGNISDVIDMMKALEHHKNSLMITDSQQPKSEQEDWEKPHFVSNIRMSKSRLGTFYT